MKKTAPHGAPRRDIRSPWRQLLSLQIPCHVHWPRSCCQSCVRLPYAENLVSGAGLHTCDGVRSWTVPARGVRSCVVRRRREPGQRHGCGGSVSGTAGRRRPLGVLLAAGRACGSCVRVGVWEACRPGVFQLCGVRYAWTLELVRRLVGLSGLLLRWPFRVFSCCCMGEGWAVEMVEMFLTMRTIRVARS